MPNARAVVLNARFAGGSRSWRYALSRANMRPSRLLETPNRRLRCPLVNPQSVWPAAVREVLHALAHPPEYALESSKPPGPCGASKFQLVHQDIATFSPGTDFEPYFGTKNGRP